MSLWELFSTFDKMPRKDNNAMSPEEIETVKNQWRAMGLKDVRI